MHISPVLWQFLVRWLTNSALFPPEASAISPYMDAFYFFLIAISAVGMIAAIILVFGFSIMYRQEKNPVATQIEGSTLLEATWTIIPLALFMICFERIAKTFGTKYSFDELPEPIRALAREL